MAHGKVAEYDDEVLVEMLASGSYTYARIAEELGLSEAYVAKVARGERRPQLRPSVRLAPRLKPRGCLPSVRRPPDRRPPRPGVAAR